MSTKWSKYRTSDKMKNPINSSWSLVCLSVVLASFPVRKVKKPYSHLISLIPLETNYMKTEQQPFKGFHLMLFRITETMEHAVVETNLDAILVTMTKAFDKVEHVHILDFFLTAG